MNLLAENEKLKRQLGEAIEQLTTANRALDNLRSSHNFLVEPIYQLVRAHTLPSYSLIDTAIDFIKKGIEFDSSKESHIPAKVVVPDNGLEIAANFLESKSIELESKWNNHIKNGGTGTSFYTLYSELANEIRGLANSKPRITEQDAREILAHYTYDVRHVVLSDSAFNGWLDNGGGRELLDKLNGKKS